MVNTVTSGANSDTEAKFGGELENSFVSDPHPYCKRYEESLTNIYTHTKAQSDPSKMSALSVSAFSPLGRDMLHPIYNLLATDYEPPPLRPLPNPTPLRARLATLQNNSTLRAACV